MGTLEPLFDTNILIDSLKGFDRARNEMDRHADKAISVIAWMEVMAGATSECDTATRVFLKRFEVVPITVAISEQTIVNRRTTRLKLPDAIILATAQVQGRTLITRNTRDFSESLHISIPYVL